MMEVIAEARRREIREDCIYVMCAILGSEGQPDNETKEENSSLVHRKRTTLVDVARKSSQWTTPAGRSRPTEDKLDVQIEFQKLLSQYIT